MINLYTTAAEYGAVQACTLGTLRLRDFLRLMDITVERRTDPLPGPSFFDVFVEVAPVTWFIAHHFNLPAPVSTNLVDFLGTKGINFIVRPKPPIQLA